MPTDAPDPARWNTLWGTWIVDELLRCGVDGFCLSPGSRCTPLTLAVARHPVARSIVHFDERGAAYFALGWAKASGRPVALICTSGTAAANYLPAIVEASQACVPLILLTADRPPELTDAGANQAIDQSQMFANYVRWQFALPCPDASFDRRALLTTIDHAAFRARRSPAGPIHINCPFREPFLSSDERGDAEPARVGSDPYTQYVSSTSGLSPVDEQQLTDVINSACRGLIVVGKLQDLDESRAVLDLARRLRWPVFPDIASGLRLGVVDDFVIPYYDQLLLSPGFRTFCAPDVVLQFGTPVTSKRLLEYLAAVDAKAHMLVADHPFRHDPIHRLTLRIDADVAACCRHIEPRRNPAQDRAWLQRLCKCNATAQAAIHMALGDTDALNEPRVAQLISENVPAEGALFLGNSMPIRDMDMYASPGGARAPVVANRGASGIDGTVATAAGYAHATGKPVTAVIGDLALLHDLNSLALLKQTAAPVILVVINNRGGGIFSFLPVASVTGHFDRFFATPHDFSFQHPASWFGLAYSAPTTPDAFRRAYREALQARAPSLIEVRVDRQENVCLHRALQDAVLAALQDVESS